MGKSSRKRTAKAKALPVSPRGGTQPGKPFASRNLAADGTGIKELGLNNLLGDRHLAAQGNRITERTRVDQGLAAQGDGGNFQPGDSLPTNVGRVIMKAAQELNVDPAKLPIIEDSEVARIITENPDIAMEGLSKLGRVLPVDYKGSYVSPHSGLDLKARVVGDMRAGRVDGVIAAAEDRVGFNNTTALHARNALLVDVQAVYERWMATKGGNDIYDLVLSPPWFNALLTYNNIAGNVWAMHMIGSDITEPQWAEERGGEKGQLLDELKWQPMEPAQHTIDWDRVRWVYSVQVYCGGMGQHGVNGVATTTPQIVPTIGPLMIWRIAVYEDGTAADVHWSQIVKEIPFHKFNNALGVFSETINMMNCVNVSVAYPTRPMPRAQRRRFERIGVRFSEIHIKPTSRSYKGQGVALADMEMPLHGVRGHYARYGVDGKGLLFGKHSGRFWHPPHMRGNREVGEVTQSYVTEAE